MCEGFHVPEVNWNIASSCKYVRAGVSKSSHKRGSNVTMVLEAVQLEMQSNHNKMNGD